MAEETADCEGIEVESKGPFLGRTPIAQTLPDDIFTVAYPKSGNTWFQNLMAGVLFGVDPEFAPDSLIQELVPDVHYKQFYKRFATPMPFKSHAEPQPDYRRVVYLLRDGRDVAVSYLYHRIALLPGPPTEDDMVRFVREDAEQWPAHVNGWQANPFGASMLRIKYEDLLQNAAGELRRLCEFLALERSDEFLYRLARQASFAKMRAKELRSGWDNPEWPTDRAFVRRGVSGSHRDELSAELLEIFLEGSRETLQRYGYL